MAVNLLAPFRLIQLFLPGMIQAGNGQGKGFIVNVASIAAFFPFPYLPDYGASKAALANMNDALRRGLKARHLDQIRTLLVCPGMVNTPMIQGRVHGVDVSSTTQPSDLAIRIINAMGKGKTELITPWQLKGWARFRLPNAIYDRLHRCISTEKQYIQDSSDSNDKVESK